MADTKISSLTTLAGSAVVDGDYFPIVDTSTGTTKKLDAGTLDEVPSLSGAFGARVTVPVVVSGTTDTLAAGDFGKINRYTNSSLVTVTIPTDGSADLEDGFWCVLASEGAAGLTLSLSGITNANTGLTSIAQGQILVVVKTSSASTWCIFGGTS